FFAPTTLFAAYHYRSTCAREVAREVDSCIGRAGWLRRRRIRVLGVFACCAGPWSGGVAARFTRQVLRRVPQRADALRQAATRRRRCVERRRAPRHVGTRRAEAARRFDAAAGTTAT